MSRDHPRPPPFARWLLARILPPSERATILADVDDFWRRKGAGGRCGRLWYWKQVLAYLWRRRELSRRSSGGDALATGYSWDGVLLRDAKAALRSLLRSPGALVPAVTTIALAVGVSAAVFAVVDELLLAPLPYERADELVRVWMEPADGSDPESRLATASAYATWRSGEAPVEGLGAFDISTATLLGVGDPRDVALVHAEPALLERLGPAPVLGRSLAPGDGTEGVRALLLAHAFWRTELGGDPDVVGRTLDLAGDRYTVIGVAGPGFRLPLNRKVMGWTALDFRLRNYRFLADLPLLGVLAWRDGETDAPGVAGLRDRLAAMVPPAEAGTHPLAVRAERVEVLARPSGTALPILFGAVLLVLALASVNVAQLLLARGAGRAPELDVRLALGAGPGALRRMLALEGVVIGVAGTLLGAGVAAGVLKVFLALDPGHLPGWADVRMTARTGVFLVGAAAAASTFAGLLPALGSVRALRSLAPGSRSGSGSLESARAQRALLAVQTALTLVLLTGSGLLLRSWAAVQAVDLGFDPVGVQVARVVLPPDRYAPGDGAAHLRFFEGLRTALAEHPRIGDAAVATALPAVGGLDFEGEFALEERGAHGARTLVTRTVSPGYFETLGMELLAGRSLGEEDDADAERVVVLSGSAARTLFPGEPYGAAVGRRIVGIRGGEVGPVRRVVGVAADAREAGPDRPPAAVIFSPYLQSRPFGRMWIAARSREEGASVWGEMRAVLGRLDPELPLVDAGGLAERMSATVAPRRFNLFLVMTLGGLSLVIAVVGTWGLAGFVASRSRREVTIRVALGARTGRALGPAAAPLLLALGVGLLLGLAGVALTSRVVASLLYRVAPVDPWSVAGALALLAVIGAAATLVPLWRAGRGEPREVLDA